MFRSKRSAAPLLSLLPRLLLLLPLPQRLRHLLPLPLLLLPLRLHLLLPLLLPPPVRRLSVLRCRVLSSALPCLPVSR